MAAPGILVGFVPITDCDRARAFYGGILGLELVSDDGFALIFRSHPAGGNGGNTVRLVRMPVVTPVPFTILGWVTNAIKAEVQRLTSAGVTFLRYPYFEQDALGIWTSPAGANVAWFHDPDGNVLALSQHLEGYSDTRNAHA